MLLSLNWLRDYVDLAGIEPERLAHDLTMRTALIEGYLDQAAQLKGVVVGEVLECGRHPDADRLSVCRVEYGAEEPAHVVCGAPNVAAGQKIVYAPVGTRLPNGLKLKKAKIRGQVSAGMICAEDELGLGVEHDGIIELDPGLVAGTPIGEVPDLCDVVFEIDNKSVTHRPDLWGHYGFARELACIYGQELRPLKLATDLQEGATDGPALELQAGAGCPMYLGLCAEHDGPGRAPDWMRFRLAACGMRALGLLVDLSNYVMLDTGQPTHPFDRDKLAGDRIVVRPGAEGEVLTTIDEVERKLVPGDIVIADGDGAVAIGGIMGGGDSEVGESTQRVFLESAVFDPTLVRRTSSRLGLRTEALARFEKDLDPALAETAVRRYAHLLRELAPSAKVATSFARAGEAAAPTRTIPLSPSVLRKRLGHEVPDERMAEVLASIGFEVSGSGEQLEVRVPSWRATRDVTIPEDLLEEVGRLVGYDQVPTPVPVGPLLVAQRAPELELAEDLRDALVNRGRCTEVFSYSTLADDVFELLGIEASEDHPRLTNALQKDASRLRPSVAPSLLAHVDQWLRQSDEVSAFEIGQAYGPGEGGAPRERSELVVLLARRDRGDGRDVLRWLRGPVEAALTALGTDDMGLDPVEPPADAGWFHPGRCARLSVGEQGIGHLGVLDPGLGERMGLGDAQVGLAVIDLEALLACPRGRTTYRAVSRFPQARMDLAFVAPYGLAVASLSAAIKKAGPKTLVDVLPFDVFRLDGDARSVAFHLVFQAADRTLTDKEVQKARTKIVAAAEALGATLR